MPSTGTSTRIEGAALLRRRGVIQGARMATLEALVARIEADASSKQTWLSYGAVPGYFKDVPSGQSRSRPA